MRLSQVLLATSVVLLSSADCLIIAKDSIVTSVNVEGGRELTVSESSTEDDASDPAKATKGKIMTFTWDEGESDDHQQQGEDHHQQQQQELQPSDAESGSAEESRSSSGDLSIEEVFDFISQFHQLREEAGSRFEEALLMGSLASWDGSGLEDTFSMTSSEADDLLKLLGGSDFSGSTVDDLLSTGTNTDSFSTDNSESGSDSPHQGPTTATTKKTSKHLRADLY